MSVSQTANKTGPIYQYKNKRIKSLDLYEPSKYPEILEKYKTQLKDLPPQIDTLNLRISFYKNQSIKWIGYINENGNYFGPGLFYTRKGYPKSMFTSDNSQLNGECIYYKKYKPIIIGSFKDGKPSGKWTYFSEDGKIKKTRIYPDTKKR